jgi:tetratricopeptide (TPR) repeat protein
MPLKDLLKKTLSDPEIDAEAKEAVQALTTSHLATGTHLKRQGLLHEAIEEYAKENKRPIHSNVDKEIAQSSYVLIGRTYKELNDLDNAKANFIKGLELWRLYGYGSAPHYELAEIFAEQGNLDEAIDLCKERLRDIPDGGIKLLLNKLLIMKQGKQHVYPLARRGSLTPARLWSTPWGTHPDQAEL